MHGVDRRITGFHQDEQGDWVAELECGHAQHVRHDPPWQNRQWVLTEQGRTAFLGHPLTCVKCAPLVRTPSSGSSLSS